MSGLVDLFISFSALGSQQQQTFPSLEPHFSSSEVLPPSAKANTKFNHFQNTASAPQWCFRVRRSHSLGFLHSTHNTGFSKVPYFGK
jgi:hypothetical protein